MRKTFEKNQAKQKLEKNKMYRDLTIIQVIEIIEKSKDDYDNGLINDIDFALNTKNLCLCFINQEITIAEKTLRQLNEEGE